MRVRARLTDLRESGVQDTKMNGLEPQFFELGERWVLSLERGPVDTVLSDNVSIRGLPDAAGAQSCQPGHDLVLVQLDKLSKGDCFV